jgi:hypothetical protein
MSEDLVLADLVEHLPKSRFIPLADVAVALDVSPSTIMEWIEEGGLRGWNRGSGSKLYVTLHRASLLEFLRGRTFGPSQPLSEASRRQLDLFPTDGTGAEKRKHKGSEI